MDNIYISKKDLDVFSKAKLLGSGKEGKCYFNIDNDLIKIYHNDKHPASVNYVGYNSIYISFPKKVYCDKETKEVLAITLPFFQGNKLVDGLSLDISIANLLEAREVLAKELVKFPNIYMEDLCLDNILYNEETNRFYLIDTGLWYDLPNSAVLNQTTIDLNLSFALTKIVSWLSEYPNLYQENPKLHYFYHSSRHSKYVNFLEYLKMLEDFVYKQTGVYPETLGNLSLKNNKKY